MSIDRDKYPHAIYAIRVFSRTHGNQLEVEKRVSDMK